MRNLIFKTVCGFVVCLLLLFVIDCQPLSAEINQVLLLAQDETKNVIDKTKTNWNMLNKAIVVLCTLGALATVCKSSNRH